MIGYAFLDSDCNLQYRTQQFIEHDNPYFWQQNKDFIMRKWRFDTEDLDIMKYMFNQIREIFRSSNLNPSSVENFCNMIGFDTRILKDAGKVQSK